MKEEKNIKFRFLIIGFILLITGVILLFYGFNHVNQNSQKFTQIKISVQPQIEHISDINGEETIVTRAVDGDTIVIASGEKVRYIGIDTPETVDPRRTVGCFGKEASDENKKLVEGKIVLLTKDVSEKDKFDRLLRFVYIKQDNGSLVFVNDFLVRNGFAKASTFPPDVKFAAQFVEAEKEARENQRGLWKICI